MLYQKLDEILPRKVQNPLIKNIFQRINPGFEHVHKGWKKVRFISGEKW